MTPTDVDHFPPIGDDAARRVADAMSRDSSAEPQALRTLARVHVMVAATDLGIFLPTIDHEISADERDRLVTEVMAWHS